MPDLLVLLLSSLNSRTPYKSQADSTAEKTDSSSSSTPLCVITNRPVPSTANGVPAATVLSSPATDSSVESREKRRYELAGAFAGLCFEKRDREVGMKCLTQAQTDLNFTVELCLSLGGFCGW